MKNQYFSIKNIKNISCANIDIIELEHNKRKMSLIKHHSKFRNTKYFFKME